MKLGAAVGVPGQPSAFSVTLWAEGTLGQGVLQEGLPRTSGVACVPWLVAAVPRFLQVTPGTDVVPDDTVCGVVHCCYQAFLHTSL